MSKHETWRTRKFWESTGGLLIEEFEVVKKSNTSARRLIDGVIVLGEETKFIIQLSLILLGKMWL